MGQAMKIPAFPITSAQFDMKLKAVTVGEGNILGQSFRQGGVCWALGLNIPGEIIKIMGDWKSAAYLAYLDQIPDQMLDHYRHISSHPFPNLEKKTV